MQWLRQRWKFVKNTLTTRPHRVNVIPLSLIYFIIIGIVHTYIYTNPIRFFHTFPVWYTSLYTILTLIVSIMIGVTLTLIIAKIREVRSKSLGLGVLGVAVGSLAAGCPGCFFGLFPIVLGVFGVGGTLAVMPLNGLEFQMLSIILLTGSILSLAKETDISCKVT
ncbi:hypothetical protein GOV11_02615 [Candidatus Woesearchaeota archaeon]|nr:hypothetical protein [Candidatus Woesearchaeota archaeon]